MEYKTGQFVDEDFLLLKASVEETKHGKKYVKFNVRDHMGEEIEQCKKWDCSDIPNWSVVHIVGKMDEYANSQHIIAKSWELGKRSVGEFSPKAPWPIDGKELLDKFKAGFHLIENKDLRVWTRDFIFYWEQHGFPETDCSPWADMLNATAAISIHHAYQHGWLEHVWEVVSISNRFREIYEGLGVISKKEGDLLTAGAFLHDIGKLFQFKCTNGVYEFSDVCKACGWNSNAEQIIGSNMLMLYCSKEGFPPGTSEVFYALNNMIISHHGNQHSIGNSTYIISRLLHFADHVSADANRMHRNLYDKTEVERDKVRESYMRIK
jgi:3'-5' exoribonuclease